MEITTPTKTETSAKYVVDNIESLIDNLRMTQKEIEASRLTGNVSEERLQDYLHSIKNFSRVEGYKGMKLYRDET